MNLSGSAVLITGGSGSFGHAMTERLLTMPYGPARVIILSRDEVKQAEMRQQFGGDSRLRFFLGDVRDRERLEVAFRGVDVVVNAAAMKIVPSCEYSPSECVKTNVTGAENVIAAALSCGVSRVVGLSTDKGSSPATLYGATKFVAERLFVSSNSYSGSGNPLFCATRYGNVLNSRSSVVPVWQQTVRECKPLRVTDPMMTRFLMTLDKSVDLVLYAIEHTRGGEVFIPKIPSFRLGDLATAIGGDGYPVEVIGQRTGEKCHESLISNDESFAARDHVDHYRLLPVVAWKEQDESGKLVESGFEYRSDTNTQWLGVEDLREMVNERVESA